MESDRFASALLRDDLRRLNSHLPKTRRTLEELLVDQSPSVLSVSGHTIKMRKEELLELAASLPTVEKSRIKLPIILLRRKDLGQGAFSVMGDPYEEYVVLVLTGSFTGTFDEFSQRGGGLSSIYKPQVSLLLRRFHSLFTLGFGTIGGLD